MTIIKGPPPLCAGEFIDNSSLSLTRAPADSGDSVHIHFLITDISPDSCLHSHIFCMPRVLHHPGWAWPLTRTAPSDTCSQGLGTNNWRITSQQAGRPDRENLSRRILLFLFGMNERSVMSGAWPGGGGKTKMKYKKIFVLGNVGRQSWRCYKQNQHNTETVSRV